MSEEEITGMDECDTEGFGTLDSSEKTVAIKGDRWWPQAKREGDKLSKRRCTFHTRTGKKAERTVAVSRRACRRENVHGDNSSKKKFGRFWSYVFIFQKTFSTPVLLPVAPVSGAASYLHV